MKGVQMWWLWIVYLSPFQTVEEKQASLGLFLCSIDSPTVLKLGCTGPGEWLSDGTDIYRA